MWKLAAAVILLLAVPARADKAKAEQYFHAGAEAFKQQNFGAAAENFEAAYKELALPEIAFSAAQAYRRQYFIDRDPQRVKRAVELYEIYLGAVKTGGRVADAADGLAEMKRELEQLTAQGTKIETVRETKTRVAVSVTVGGQQESALGELAAPSTTDALHAEATLDGKRVELFAPVDVTPGEHTVEVKAAGYFPVTIKRPAIEGASDVWVAELKPQPAHLAITVEAGASVAVDGKILGTAPLPPQELPAGRHTLAITRRGREAVVRELVLARGETNAVNVPLEQTGKRRAVPWVAGGAGVLALAAGISIPIALSADSRMSSLDHKRLTMGLSQSELNDYHDATSRRNTFRDLAYGFGGAAVAVGATAAFLYFFDTPVVATNTGVAVVGSF